MSFDKNLNLVDLIRTTIAGYLCNMIYKDNIDLFDRARLLGTYENVTMDKIVLDIEKDFSSVSIFITDAMVYRNNYWNVTMTLNPLLLTEAKDRLVSMLEELDSTYDGGLIYSLVVGFDICNLPTNKVINLDTWFNFANMGYIYVFDSLNYKNKFGNKYILNIYVPDLTPVMSLSNNAFNNFIVMNDVFFSLNDYHIVERDLRVLDRLKVKYGLVLYSTQPSKLLDDLRDCVLKGIIDSNIILCFNNCDFTVEQKTRLEVICIKYNIEHYYSTEQYYIAIKKYLIKGTSLSLDSVSILFDNVIGK